MKQQLTLDRRRYQLEVHRASPQPPNAPRLLIPSYLPNPTALDILRVCIASIQQNTPEPHELWVIDNNSPRHLAEKLLDIPYLNVVLNRTEPLPPQGRKRWPWQKERTSQDQWEWGSYANAVALELGLRLIDPATRYVMFLHMDILACQTGWLSRFQERLNDKVVAVGARMVKNRVPEGVLHIFGYMVDYPVFRRLGLTLFPDLPRYDVGDYVTIALRQAGYQVEAFPIYPDDPAQAERLAPASPFHGLYVGYNVDENGDVFFAHLGRAVRKTTSHQDHGITPEAWLQLAHHSILHTKS